MIFEINEIPKTISSRIMIIGLKSKSDDKIKSDISKMFRMKKPPGLEEPPGAG